MYTSTPEVRVTVSDVNSCIVSAGCIHVGMAFESFPKRLYNGGGHLQYGLIMLEVLN